MTCFIRHKGYLFQSFDIVPDNLYGTENIFHSHLLIENFVMHSAIDLVKNVT
jgi:hypothetical protein